MSAFEVITLILSLGGGLLGGHRIGKKRAATLATILSYARQAAHVTVVALRHVHRPQAAHVVDVWAVNFADALAASGIELSEGQHGKASAEARAVMVRLCTGFALDDLRRALDDFEPKFAATMNKLKRARLDEPFTRDKSGKESR